MSEKLQLTAQTYQTRQVSRGYQCCFYTEYRPLWVHWYNSYGNKVLGHWDSVCIFFCFPPFLRVQHQTLEDHLVYKQSLSIASRHAYGLFPSQVCCFYQISLVPAHAHWQGAHSVSCALVPSYRTWLLMGSCISQLTGWRVFWFFHKRKNKCLINVLSSSFLQDEPAGGLSARLMGHSGHRAHTLLENTLPFLRCSVPTTTACTIQTGMAEPKANSAAFPTP